MAFEPKNFVLCSKFPLFKAQANLWLYSTNDTLEDCLATGYFQPRLNISNQDSPDVGDIIQVLCEYSKIAYLKITSKTEKPYTITVARTFLENEADIIAELADKASKTTDFATPITDENLGITQAEQSELEDKIDLAANSGRMITAQGFWYAKMHSETIALSAEDGTNYADFSQVDGQGNPVIVTYNRVSGAWVQDQTITPPADYDGYVAITSKIWDIAEQDGQQGGRVLWNHVSKEFTPYPQIINFDSVALSGDSTVVMPVNPDGDNIANVAFVLEHASSRNVGDIFYTSRTDAVLNGAVPCDGTSYQTTDFSGSQAPGALLQAGKLPYVPLSTYATLLATNGSVGVFGWDGLNTTEFKVPTLTDIFIETGTSAQVGDYIAPSLPNVKGDVNIISDSSRIMHGFGNATGAFSVELSQDYGSDNNLKGDAQNYKKPTLKLNASNSSAVYKDAATTVQPNAVRYRAMIQLSTGTSDQSLGMLAEVAYTGDYSDLLNKPTIPTAVSQLTNDSGYIDSIKTINNNSLVGSGNLELSTYLPFGSWPTTGTTKLFCDTIAADASAVKGKAYLGEVTFSDLPSSMANGEVVVEIMDGTTAANKIIVLTLNSGNVAPYMWRYTYWNQGNNVSGWQTWATSAQGAKADTAVQPGDLATVATTGAYSDLTGTPTIPAAQVNSDWNASSGVAEILNKPTIPTVNNSTITITQGGVTKGSFTLNQASASTIALDAGGGGGVSVGTSIDAEIVGTPTISDGDVSNLSYQNYLTLPGKFDVMTGVSSFEIVVAFTTYASAISNQNILDRQGSGGVAIKVNNMNISFRATQSVSETQSLTGVTTLSPNTKYYAKVEYDGTNYTLSISTDGVTYTQEATAVATYLPGEVGLAFPLTAGWQENSPSWGLGAIHMDAWYVKKNGVLVWQGMDAPGLHQRVAVGHEVIEFQAPTSQNNYTWYRKYADGWVEQGGINNIGTTRPANITFPVEMSDGNYTVTMADCMTNTYLNTYVTWVYNRTATGFTVYSNGGGSGTNAGYTFSWQVSGMAA